MTTEVECVTHPELCQRCSGPNITWHVPSPLWNAVLRDTSGIDDYEILCPQCFAILAEERGVVTDRAIWCIRLDQGLAVELDTVSPSGRVWDSATCLWVSPAPEEGKL